MLIKDFGIEYAKSGRAACAGCHLKISKDEVRIKKMLYDTEVGMKFGGQVNSFYSILIQLSSIVAILYKI